MILWLLNKKRKSHVISIFMCICIYAPEENKEKPPNNATKSFTHTYIYIYINFEKIWDWSTAVILGGVNGLDRPRNLLEMNLSWKTTWFLNPPPVVFFKIQLRSLRIGKWRKLLRQLVLQWIYPHVINFQYTTLPKTNIGPENRPSQKENNVFQPSFLKGYASFKKHIVF